MLSIPSGLRKVYVAKSLMEVNMRQHKKIAFFLRAYNDFDHFAPIIAECIKRGDEPTIVLISDFELESDYRYQFLKQLGKFTLIIDIDKDFATFSAPKSLLEKVKARLYFATSGFDSLLGKFYRHLFADYRRYINFLQEKQIDVCVFEWSHFFC